MSLHAHPHSIQPCREHLFDPGSFRPGNPHRNRGGLALNRLGRHVFLAIKETPLAGTSSILVKRPAQKGRTGSFCLGNQSVALVFHLRTAAPRHESLSLALDSLEFRVAWSWDSGL